jgi:hypothetical protein
MGSYGKVSRCAASRGQDWRGAVWLGRGASAPFFIKATTVHLVAV